VNIRTGTSREADFQAQRILSSLIGLYIPGKVLNVSEKTAAADQVVKFSRKCSECGLRNFIDAKVCRRCESDLSRRSAGAKKIKQHVPVEAIKPRQSKAGRVVILVAALAILSGLVVFYGRQVPAVTEPVAGKVDLEQSAQPSEGEPFQDAATEEARSEQSAKHVLAGLRHFQEHFQDTPKSSMSYEEYDQMLTNLKSDLNNTLPTFVRHDPSDERFRKEVAAALRDYTAAGNWWKTTIRNSKVFSDADRTTRLQSEWGSAQTHLDNAEKLLLP
jgi:ribosomal protein L40E